MKRIVLGLATIALVGGLLTSSAEAAHSRGGTRSHSRGHAAHRGHAVHRGAHHNFHGSIQRGYRGWGRVWYNPRYRCNWYFNTQCGCWYYWYGPQQCYLPVRYIAQFPPA